MLSSFQDRRQKEKQKLLDATRRSFTWYETFAEKMERLEPVDFVFDYTDGGPAELLRRDSAAEFPNFVEHNPRLRTSAADAARAGSSAA